MASTVQDVLAIMRRGAGRRNTNDPDSNDAMFFQYLQDFISLTMSDDVKLFEQFGTLSFTIDETTEDGVYTFNDVGAADQFSNISMEAFISIEDPVNNSTSWNELQIYQDPGEFYSIWGINNTEILVRGYPTMMLYYGTEFVFRTLPEQSYVINIYGYKINPEFGNPNEDLPFDYWLRYLAYGSLLNYARDFRYPPDQIAMIEKTFAVERKRLLTRTHNQIKLNRAFPRF